MSATAAMEVNAEARRILAVSISKLYASRSQRGGLRLHRSLLLSLVMRSARDIYHSSRESEAQLADAEAMETGSCSWDQIEASEQTPAEPTAEEPDCAEKEFDGESTEDKENQSPTRQSRKRRGKVSAAPDFLPSKRARLEPGEERYAAMLSSCRAGAVESLTALSLNRVIPAF
ncbi:immediate early response 2b [Hippoglossus hippoglossus]|uniref:immediate early response 2b n=1 Tax=Hippoglossus hippoglossus TaxID=8267 RepID=UPI00148BA3B3|nr:immediate early response 2b [Hippoglossus hippoglossus]XP_034999749.1 immediate early response 2b [Hippoglossus stenolepis]